MEELKDIELLASKAQSLQSQLYHALRSRILSGRYEAGMKLPASRRMAEELRVSRNTILLALEHLSAEGYIERRRGAGTYVAKLIPDHFAQSDMKKKARRNLAEVDALETRAELQPAAMNEFFAPGVPSLSEFPQGIWKRLMKLHLGRTALMGFHSSQGYAPLRKAIAQYLRRSRGCDCHERQIIITDGAQQALSLAAQVLLKDKESVYVENPGYLRARQAFQSRGCQIKGVDVDELGMIPDLLPEQADGKVLSLTPTHQYPMGGVLPLSRRLEILNWVRSNNLWLLEDDYDSEFHFYQKPVAAMQGLGFSDQVVYMGSFSKVIFPALRLGYLLVPEEMVEAFVTEKFHMSGESNLLEQAVTADFITEGHFNRHLLRMRKLYQSKLELLLKACATMSNVQAITPGAGMHVVLLFNEARLGFDKLVVKKMREQGVNGNPLSNYYLHKPLVQTEYQGLVLGFANASEEQIIRGLNVIDGIIKSLV